MPELPEVETIVRGLQTPLLGRTITAAKVLWHNTARPSVVEVEAKLPQRRIEALSRRGKYLKFVLSGGKMLFIHLKMSGDLRVLPQSQAVHPHTRAFFNLDNGNRLEFKDPRKFGRIHLTDNPQSVIGTLGPEPLADDFSVDDFIALFERRSGRLKPLLMNQTFIAGLGNIYAAEACFWARLDPRRPANTLSAADLARLYHAIRRVLRHGIMLKGATLDNVYRGGEFQNHFQVYGKTGKPCPRCGTPIARVMLAGRSTFFCPACQSAASTASI